MRFKDAAYEILKKTGKPLHYNEITELARIAGLLETEGSTPEATMGSRLYTDTLDADSRFRRGDKPGTFALKMAVPIGIQSQIENIKEKVRKDLRKHLLKMQDTKFEELIRLLLEEMMFEETETTPYSNDKGVDVRGVLRTNKLSTVKVAIQAKRWTGNVPSRVVRDLRGSLKVGEQGLVITPSDFTSEAKSESQAASKTPITLINGELLVDLLIQYQMGVKQEQYIVPAIDPEYWTEILGVTLDEHDTEPVNVVTKLPEKNLNITFPVAIQGKHHDQVCSAELLDINGKIRLNGIMYERPTTAAKVIVTDWKQVNGWDFWRYLNSGTGQWEKIGKLR